ncbi:transcriptional regulator [Enterobacter cloacae]|uniref:Transcriptional regulator n=1 Tax=Enterobacter cloacae TaxID=550 RepID=A0A377M2A9_ENTCL|nr:transcriptional regulator [Enterobacter cloacae]
MGVAIADLLLSLDALNSGLLALPFKEAIATGDGYYIVWPKNSLRKKSIECLLDWLNLHAPVIPSLDIICLEYDEPSAVVIKSRICRGRILLYKLQA